MSTNNFDQTDPLYKQLMGEYELIQPSRTGQQKGKRNEKKRNYRRNDPSSDGGPERPFSDFAPEFPDPSHGDSMKSFFKFLVPFDDPWRLTMGFSVFFLLLNTAASRGWLPIIGLSAFASASSVTEIRVEQLNSQIFEMIKSHCAAATTESKQFYAQKQGELLRRYEDISGRSYQPVPTCRDLGIKEVLIGEQ